MPGLLELPASLLELGDRDRAERRGGWQRAALIHVPSQRCRAAAQQSALAGLGSRRSRGRGGAGPVSARRGGQHVGLRDPPTAGGSLTTRQINAFARRDPPGHRRGVGSGAGRRYRGCRTFCALRGCLITLGLGLGACCGRGGAHPGDHLPNRHGLAVLGQDLGDGARRRRGELHVHLVRRYLDHRVAFLHGVANLHRPLQNRALGH